MGVYLHPRFASTTTRCTRLTIGRELPVGRRGGGESRNVLKRDHRFAVTDTLSGNRTAAI